MLECSRTCVLRLKIYLQQLLKTAVTKVIDAEGVVHLQDERERKNNDKAVRAAARKKKQGTTKELVPRTK